MKLSGTKYFILILDDYNRNHINNGLVSITELSKKLEYPSYFTPEYLCLRENQTIEQQPVNFDFDNTNDDNYFNSLGDKLNRAYGSIPQIIPTAPRT
jgi:hypothetical protein